jgi:hypothetical protein
MKISDALKSCVRQQSASLFDTNVRHKAQPLKALQRILPFTHNN